MAENNGTVKYRTTFEKKGRMVFISHLDLMTLFRRAIRRTGLPFALTRGFTPRVKISMPKALKLGAESSCEEMTFWLTEKRDEGELTRVINGELPEGVSVRETVMAGT